MITQIHQIEQGSYLFPNKFQAISHGYLIYNCRHSCHLTHQKFHAIDYETFCKNLKTYLAVVGCCLKIFYPHYFLEDQIQIVVVIINFCLKIYKFHFISANVWLFLLYLWKGFRISCISNCSLSNR